MSTKMPAKTRQSQRRPRDAVSTRSEIFTAAMRLFAERNYEEVGLREIVAPVGVDVALIKRYFGSKEQLFAEVIDFANSTHATQGLFAGSRSEVAKRLARFITDIDSDDEDREVNLLSLMVTLRAAHSERAESILRANMEERVLSPLAEWLGGVHSAERAALLTAYLIGVATMQRLIKVNALRSGDLNVIVDYVTAGLQTCIDGVLSNSLNDGSKLSPKTKKSAD